MLKFHKIGVHGLTKFKTAQELNIAALAPGVYKLEGNNGAGKTTFLESMHAALFGRMISRTDRLDAYLNKDCPAGRINLEFNCNGKEYKSIIQVEGTKGAEYYLYENGNAVVKGGYRALGDFTQANIITKEIFNSCLLRSQIGTGNFLDMSQAERKDLFNRLLNLERHRAIFDAAKKQISELDIELGRVKATQDGLNATLSNPDMSELEIHEALGRGRVQLSALESELAAATPKLAEFQQKQAEANAKYQAAVEAYQTAQNGLQALSNKHAEIIRDMKAQADRKAEAEKVLLQKPFIELAVERVLGIQNELKDLRASMEQSQQAYDQETRRIMALSTDASKINMAIAMVEQQLKAANHNSGKLDEVPCKETDYPKSCKYVSDALADKNKISELTQELTGLEKSKAAIVIDHDLANELKAEVYKAREQIAVLESELPQQQAREKLLPNLMAAEETIKNADAMIKRLGEEFTTLQNHLAATEKLEDPRQQTWPSYAVDIQTWQTGINSINQQIVNQKAQITGYENELETRQKIEGKRKELIGQYEDLATKRRRLIWIRNTFSPDGGIPAVEVENAGPLISETINHLLHTCYSTRFSVKFITCKPKASGEGEKNVFEMHVLDTDNGVTLPVSSLSGGEKVLVGLATQLAITDYLGKKSNLKPKLLILDECLGALTEANAAIAVQMLRMSMKIIGLDHLIYVAHLDALADYSDGVIRIENGHIYQ